MFEARTAGQGLRESLGSWRDQAESPLVNVGPVERLASVLGGAALASYGLSRRSLGGLGLAALGGGLLYRGITGTCPAYGILGVDTAKHRHGPRTSVRAGHGVRVDETIVINRSPEELHRFWRNLENLPRFMRHLESVKGISAKRSHWAACGPLGFRVEWDAETITDRPPETIAWRSLPNSDVDTAGSVHFRKAPGGRGTEVHIILKYDPPGGKVTASLAKLFGKAPEQEIREDLQHLKQALEAEEPSGRASGSSQGGIHRLEAQPVRDVVGEASEESFPASDAPAW